MLSTMFRPIFFLKFKCIQKQKLSGFGIPLHNLYRFINLPVSVPSLISLPFEVITKHQEACEMASRPSPLFSEVCCATLSCQFIAAQNQHSNRSTTTFQQLRYTLSLHRLKDCAGNETSFTITLLSSYCYANDRKKGQSVLRWKGDSGMAVLSKLPGSTACHTDPGSSPSGIRRPKHLMDLKMLGAFKII